MNIYNIFTTFVIVLAHLLQTNDHRALIPLLDAPEYDTSYSIYYIIIPPAIPLTIDPSPPVLAPAFNPDYVPTPPHTFTGATSAIYGTNSRSVDWTVNFLAVILLGLLVHNVVAWFALYINNESFDKASSAVQDRPSLSSTASPAPPILSAPSTPTSFPPRSPINGLLRRSSIVSFLPIPTTLPSEDSDEAVLSSRGIHAAAPFVSAPVNAGTGDISGISSSSSMPNLHPSSSISDEDDRSEVAISFNGISPVSAGSIANTATWSVQNFLDEITLALSPSPSFTTRGPPPVPKIPSNLWEDLVNGCFDDEPSVWDCYPRATPRTPVDLDDEVTSGHDEGAEVDVVEPLVHAWTIDADESPATSTSTSTSQDVETVESRTELAGSSRTTSSRIPRLALTPAWKKSISALISGDEGKSVGPVPALTTTISAVSSSTDIITPGSSSTAPSSKLDTPKKLDWSEDVEQTFFNHSGNVAGEKACDRGSKRVSKSQDRIFEKCDCALENALFEPESWNKFKIPASCHPRPPIHFFSPREHDERNPSTRIVVDNVNAFRHHSAEPNVPYTNKDIEDSFYPAGAKNVRCFDGRTVGGVVRYNSSYAVVDFETVEEAKAAFKMFQGRKAYPGSYHLRLKFVDVNDRTFGRRMAVSMGPMERSEEERKAFVEFIEDLDRVNVDLARVVLPTRPGFALPALPVTPAGS